MGQKRNAPDYSDDKEAIFSGNCGATTGTIIVVSRRNSLEGSTITKAKCGRMDIGRIRQCYGILTKLMNHPFGWVFNQPVDPVGLKIPDYFSVISKPMDLGTIKHKLRSKLYSSPHLFAADVMLTFSNAMQYHPPGNDIHTMAEELDNSFRSAWKSLEGQWRRANANLTQHIMMNKQTQTINLRPTRIERPSGDAKVESVTSSAPADATRATKRRRFAPNSNSTEQFSCSEHSIQRFPGGGYCSQHSVACALEHIKASSEVRPCDPSCGLDVVEIDGNDNVQSLLQPLDPTISGKGNNELPFEKPMSPTRALRVAMLKTRFADTIAKAQEKKALIDHGKKIDPEKLQPEREKTERWQKEEKARIEAQLRVAEISAQKKTNGMKMQRKSESEREAARLALQKMEKTVEIDNSAMGFAELDGTLVSFLSGSDPYYGPTNPLEQLGLFLNNDDLKEEEYDRMSAVDIVDLEEGEISCWHS